MAALAKAFVVGKGGRSFAAHLLPAGALPTTGGEPRGERFASWPIVVVSEVDAPGTMDDAFCVINPPPIRDLLSALGPEQTKALTLVCCLDEDHIASYGGADSDAEYAVLWNYVDHASDFLGSFPVANIERLVGEPLVVAPVGLR